MANALMAMKTMARWKKYSLIALIVILAIGGVMIKSEKPKQSVQAQNRTSVRAQPASTMEAASVLSFKANLEPIEEGIVASNVSGQVVRILFEDGDRVAQGQALAALDDKDLRNQLQSAQINLQKLEMTLDSGQRSYDRTKALFDSGAISKSAFEDAEMALNMAKANVETAQVSIQGINNSLDNCVLHAPINGEIDEKNISLGQYVMPGTVLCKVLDTSSIQAVIQIKQSDLDKVKVGQKASLKLSKKDALGYAGQIDSIDASANTARVFDCKIQVDNQEGKLRTGIFGYVELANDQKREIISIPLSALVGSEGSYFVFVMEDGFARKRSVNIGEIQKDRVEVTSGVKVGEKVIITNLNTLQDGDLVDVIGKGV